MRRYIHLSRRALRKVLPSKPETAIKLAAGGMLLGLVSIVVFYPGAASRNAMTSLDKATATELAVYHTKAKQQVEEVPATEASLPHTTPEAQSSLSAPKKTTSSPPSSKPTGSSLTSTLYVGTPQFYFYTVPYEDGITMQCRFKVSVPLLLSQYSSIGKVEVTTTMSKYQEFHIWYSLPGAGATTAVWDTAMPFPLYGEQATVTIKAAPQQFPHTIISVAYEGAKTATATPPGGC